MHSAGPISNRLPTAAFRVARIGRIGLLAGIQRIGVRRRLLAAFRVGFSRGVGRCVRAVRIGVIGGLKRGVGGRIPIIGLRLRGVFRRARVALPRVAWAFALSYLGHLR